MFWYIVVYIVGLPAGFLLAASKKEKWWCDNHRSHRTIDWGGELAVIITFLWFLFYGWLFIVWLITKLYNAFMTLVNGAIPLMSRTAEYMQKREEQKKARKRIVVPPTPAVKHGGYRDAAPKPCIACGTETSIDQSTMQVVEDDDDEDESYEIRKPVNAY